MRARRSRTGDAREAQRGRARAAGVAVWIGAVGALACVLSACGGSPTSPADAARDAGVPVGDARLDVVLDATAAVPCASGAFTPIGRLEVRAPAAVTSVPDLGPVAFRAGTEVMVDGNWIPRQYRAEDTALAVTTCSGGRLEELPSQLVRVGLDASDPLLYFRLVRDLAASGPERIDRNYFLVLRQGPAPAGPPPFVLAHFDFLSDPSPGLGLFVASQAPGWTVQADGCSGCAAHVVAEGYFSRPSLQLHCEDCPSATGTLSVRSAPIPLPALAGDYLHVHSALGLLPSWRCTADKGCVVCEGTPCSTATPSSRAWLYLRFLDAAGDLLGQPLLVRSDKGGSLLAHQRFDFPVGAAQYREENHDPAAFFLPPAGAVAAQLEVRVGGGPVCAEVDDLMLLRRDRVATDHVIAKHLFYEPTVEHQGGLKIVPERCDVRDDVLEHGFRVTAQIPLLLAGPAPGSGPRHARALRLAADFLQESSQRVFGGALPEEAVTGATKHAEPFILLGEKDDALVQAYLAGMTPPDGGLDGEEGYVIRVRANAIVVAGSGPRGLAYGAAALAELFPIDRAVAASAPFFIRQQDLSDQPERTLRATMAHLTPSDLSNAKWSAQLEDGYRSYCRRALRARMNAILFTGSPVFALDPQDDRYTRMLGLLELCATDALLEIIPGPFNPKELVDYRQDADARHAVFVASGRRTGLLSLTVPAPRQPGDAFIAVDLPRVTDGYRKRWPLTQQDIDAENTKAAAKIYEKVGDELKVLNADDGQWYVYADCAAAPCATAPVITGLCPVDASNDHATYCWGTPSTRRLPVEVQDGGGQPLVLEDRSPASYDYKLDGTATTELRRLRPTKVWLPSRLAEQQVTVQYSYVTDDDYASSCLSEPEVYRRAAAITADLASRLAVPIRYLHIGLDEMALLGKDLRDLRNTVCGSGGTKPCTRGEVLDHGVRRIMEALQPVFKTSPPTLLMWGDMPIKLARAGDWTALDNLPREVWMVPWHYHYGDGSRSYIQETVARYAERGFALVGGPLLGSSSSVHLWARPYANVRVWADALAGAPGGGKTVRGLLCTKFEPESAGVGWDFSPLILEGALGWRTK